MRDLVWLLAVIVAASAAPVYNLTLPPEEYEILFEEAPQTLECDQFDAENMMREV